MNLHTQLLIIDDDAAVRALLRSMFEEHEFTVHDAPDLTSALAILRTHDIKLVTLDLMLGKEDGLSASRRIKDVRDVPIIMITAKGTDMDRIIGLEVGADDYIAKPFNVREVLARVRAVLRRAGGSEKVQAPAGAELAFGDFHLSIERRELRNGATGEVVNLTGAEFNLLRVLVERPGRVFSRDSLLDLLQGGAAETFDRSIDTLVARLRKKIEPDLDHPTYIKTVRGAGYVFAGDVRPGACGAR